VTVPETIFGSEARQVVAGHCCRDHLDRATGQPKLHGPYRAAAAPVVELLNRGHEDALFAQFDLQSLINHRRFAPKTSCQ
jgi:hypothetical protein